MERAEKKNNSRQKKNAEDSTTEVKYTFNTKLFSEYQEMSRVHPVVKECVEFIVGVSVSGVSVRTADAKLQEYFNDVVIPFVRQALRVVILVGWAPYRIVAPKEGSKYPLVPVVVPYEFIEASFILELDTYTSRIEVLRHEDEKYVSDAIVHDTRNTDATRILKNTRALMMYDYGCYRNDNFIHSPLDALYYDFSMLLRRRNANMRAEQIRSCPTVYLTKAPEHGKSDLQEMIYNSGGTTFNLYNGGMSAKRPDWKHSAETAGSDIESNVFFHEEQARMNRRPVDIDSPQYENNVYIPAPGMVLAGVPHLPMPVTNILEAEVYFNSTVYKMFGLSRLDSQSVQSSRRQNRSVGFTHDTENLELLTTLKTYHEFVTHIFGEVYEGVFCKKLPVGVITVHAYDNVLEYMERGQNGVKKTVEAATKKANNAEKATTTTKAKNAEKAIDEKKTGTKRPRHT